MNNFIFDEMSAAEYRYERMAEAKAHNKFVQRRKKSLLLKFYAVLGKLGAYLEKLGVRIQNRYNGLAVHEEHRMLANSAE